MTQRLRRFIYGPSNLPVEQINSSEKALYLHHDRAGSTRLITGSTGTVEGKCTYSAYGTPTCEGTATTPLGYDDQYTSADTGLIYLRARAYDPATAQFLSVDPAVSVTRAPYNYAGDNPLNYRDRSGLGWEEVLEGPGIPNPWSEAEHASEELLRPGVEAVEHGAEYVLNAAGEEIDEPAEQGRTSGECGVDGPQLRREGEELLGRTHSPAGRERWQEWWNNLSRAARKAYREAGGPRPRGRG